MGEQEEGALLDVIDNSLVHRFLHHVRRQEHDNGGTLDRIIRLHDGQSVGFGLGPAGASLAQSDDNVESRVLEVEGMRPALAAVAENRDLAVAENRRIYICFQIHFHGWYLCLIFKSKKTPQS